MSYCGPYNDNLSTFTLLKQIAQMPQNLLLARVKEVQETTLTYLPPSRVVPQTSRPFTCSGLPEQALLGRKGSIDLEPHTTRDHL